MPDQPYTVNRLPGPVLRLPGMTWDNPEAQFPPHIAVARFLAAKRDEREMREEREREERSETR